MPILYPNQWWPLIYYNPSNKLKGKTIDIKPIFIEENALKFILNNFAAFLFRTIWYNSVDYQVSYEFIFA